MAEKSEKQLVVGILAHVDSGKTTLSEAMLYRAGSIRKLGRVDNKDAFLDTDTLEKARGITIFSKQALLKTGSTNITLLDTPGHVDFSTETERTLQVLDYAVLVISGTDGVQSHTETLWRLLRRYHIPTFVFINKMDLPGPGKEALLSQLSHRLGEGFVDFGAEQAERDEALALCDERLMEKMAQEKKTLYLLGAKPGIAEQAAEKLRETYPGLTIAGTHDGYFQKDETVLADIRASMADVVCVCLGAPKQEKWMAHNGTATGAHLLLGLGGSLDVFAGVVQRAPEIFSKTGMEWFYRLLKQPSRIGRMMKLPLFLVHVRQEKGKRK